MKDLTYLDPVIGIIRPSVEEDCHTIGRHLRTKDAIELWDAENLMPIDACLKSFNKSVVSMTMEHDNTPIGMFGIIIEVYEPVLWMVTTDNLKSVGRAFVRRTREWIDKMLEDYPTLSVYVDVRNKESDRWINFVGGEYKDVVFMGIADMPFRKYIFTRKQVATRDNIGVIEMQIAKHPNAMFGDCCPLDHTFVDGAYVRTIRMPAGLLGVSKIHKKTHPYFIMKGDVSILTEEGLVRIKAPFSGITKAGTKRVLFCHTDVEWTTVHVTNEIDLKKIEDEVIAKDFSELTSTEKAFIEVFAEVKK